ncbi:hypothetical protein UB33_05700 [Photobacterium angustum]|uniref:hypothetical protein n=1 Tax=Photobacterium angustum TaxID=661 RepID=UPI0005DCF58C|nr:hypothetical protein [Photobacterium angustum]KJF93399.1 hypothetical protein UB39_15965 [Photobacterium angustum]KJG07179.1 hypothetical protein UB33_05700 [Photobacterium angustum]PSV90396.1 hypothetical protein CTN01_15840 [Photobacterium angustum]PSW83195.1 hypothetical protein CTN03_01780 [Photobacterium angustum]
MEAQTIISFLAGLIGAGIGAYAVSYFKVSAQVTAQTNHIKEILDQKYLMKNQEELAKIDTVTNKIDEILEQQRAITSINEAAKIDVLTAKMDQVVEQQKNITTTTETIKSNVDIDNWRKKENQILCREKIELLYSKFSEYFLECKIMLSPITDSTTIEHKKEASKKVFLLCDEVNMISNLYFRSNSELMRLKEIFNWKMSASMHLFKKYSEFGLNVPIDEYNSVVDESLQIAHEIKVLLSDTMARELD